MSEIGGTSVREAKLYLLVHGMLSIAEAIASSNSDASGSTPLGIYRVVMSTTVLVTPVLDWRWDVTSVWLQLVFVVFFPVLLCENAAIIPSHAISKQVCKEASIIQGKALVVEIGAGGVPA